MLPSPFRWLRLTPSLQTRSMFSALAGGGESSSGDTIHGHNSDSAQDGRSSSPRRQWRHPLMLVNRAQSAQLLDLIKADSLDISTSIAYKRVIANDNVDRNVDDPTHIEVTADTIDIVFDTTEHYQRVVSNLLEENLDIPACLRPVDYANYTSYGAGAIIKLSRKSVFDYLEQKRRDRPFHEPPPLAALPMEKLQEVAPVHERAWINPKPEVE